MFDLPFWVKGFCGYAAKDLLLNQVKGFYVPIEAWMSYWAWK